MATWDFPCSDPIDANISLASGRVTLTAAPTDVVTVSVGQGRSGDRADDHQASSDVTVDFADRHLVVSEPPRRGLGWRSKDLYITISMPAGSRAAVQAASADVSCRGEYGGVDIRTASGRIEAQTVLGPAEVSTISGSVQIAEVAEVNAQTASGSLRVAHAVGDVNARSASGPISIGSADASVTARTASGSIFVGRVARGRADLTAVSGDIDARIAPGTGVLMDLSSLSGRVTSDLAPSDQEGDADLRLRCQTVSGSIQVSRAASADAASADVPA
jgi:hypothetical protein